MYKNKVPRNSIIIKNSTENKVVKFVEKKTEIIKTTQIP